jgi:hypothetical protein
MTYLNDSTRTMIEKMIDSWMKDPKVTEKTYRFILEKQGIQPNIETVLSFLTGIIIGTSDGAYAVRYNRLMNVVERKELTELMNRRVSELRQALLSTRIEE